MRGTPQTPYISYHNATRCNILQKSMRAACAGAGVCAAAAKKKKLAHCCKKLAHLLKKKKKRRACARHALGQARAAVADVHTALKFALKLPDASQAEVDIIYIYMYVCMYVCMYVYTRLY